MNFLNKIIQTYKKGKRYDETKQELQHTKQELDDTINEYVELQEKVAELESSLDSAEELIKKYESKEEKISVEEVKDFYMMPHRQGRWTHNMRSRGRKDVRLLFRDIEDFEALTSEAQHIVGKGRLSERNMGVDDIVSYVYQHINDKWDWRYVRDQEKYGVPEYWEDPSIAVQEKEGDCDSKAGAMHMVIREVLKEVGHEDSIWRLRFVASRTLTEPHAYNVWLADDHEWYVIESTLDPDGSLSRTWMNTPLRHNNFYYDYWGFATRSNTWWGSRNVVNSYEEEENKGGLPSEE